MLLFLAHRDIVYQRVITCSLGRHAASRGFPATAGLSCIPYHIQ